MGPVELLVGKLQNHPDVTYALRDDGNRIDIEPPNPGGFAVSLSREGEGWSVHAGDHGFHWHLRDPEEALDLLAFCLSEDRRLKVEERMFQVRSTLEARSDEGWSPAYRTGLFALRLWKPTTQATYENKLVRSRGQGS